MRLAPIVLLFVCITCAQAQKPAPASKIATPPPVPELVEANRQLCRGAHDEALATLERFLKDQPRDVNARFLRAVVLAEANRVDEAIAAFTELAAANPELSEPHNNLAVLYASQGRLDRARSELEQAITANPENATALENLGDIYARLAVRSYEQSLKLDASNRAARAKLALARELAKPLTTGEKKE